MTNATIFWICFILAVLHTIWRIIRDIFMEIAIQKGMDPKEARKKITFWKLIKQKKETVQ